MRAYSSTILKYFSGNCPKSLDYFEKGEPYDRSIFQAGIAAHAILQTIAEKNAREYDQQETVADAVVDELITVGRAFNNVPEPPMSPEDAMAGRDIALNYLQWNELPQNMLTVEGGFGMDKTGRYCHYDSDERRYGAIIDLNYQTTIGDEEWQADLIVARDYKSAWPTNEADLDTLQRKGQAVLTWMNAEHAGIKCQGVRQEAVNLRTGMSFTRDILFDEEGLALLERWRKDILQACDAADKTRKARPGAGCLSCPYTLSCDDCLYAYKGDGVTQATQLAAIESIRKNLIKVLKGKTSLANIKVSGGFVGFRKQDKQSPVKDAHKVLADYWFGTDVDAEIMGLLKGMKLTKSNIEQAINVLYPKRDKDNAAVREDVFNAALGLKSESRFGVYPTQGLTNETLPQ